MNENMKTMTNHNSSQ